MRMVNNFLVIGQGICYNICRNLSLGFTTKARACKVVSQEGSPGATSHALGSAKECEGMNPQNPK